MVKKCFANEAFFLAAIGLGRAMRRKARRLALAEVPILFSVSYCVGKTVKSVNVCVKCPVFNAGGGCSVPPPISCRTLGRVARRKAHRLALAGGANAIFCVVSCWQNVKVCECFLKMRSFNCTGGGSVPPPTELLDTRPGDAPKGTLPGLDGGANPSFCVVLC